MSSVCVWRDTLEKPVCKFKTPPCVDSKRPCVNGHHAHVWRVSSTVLLTKNVPRGVLTWRQRGSPKKQQNHTHFQFENRLRTTHCLVLQSFALPDKSCSTPALLRETLEGISCEIRRFLRVYRTICTSVTQQQHTQTQTHTHTHMYMYMKMSVYMYMSASLFSLKKMKPLCKITGFEQHTYTHVLSTAQDSTAHDSAPQRNPPLPHLSSINTYLCSPDSGPSQFRRSPLPGGFPFFLGNNAHSEKVCSSHKEKWEPPVRLP